LYTHIAAGSNSKATTVAGPQIPERSAVREQAASSEIKGSRKMKTVGEVDLIR
jgi:hypothetical protein